MSWFARFGKKVRADSSGAVHPPVSHFLRPEDGDEDEDGESVVDGVISEEEEEEKPMRRKGSLSATVSKRSMDDSVLRYHRGKAKEIKDKVFNRVPSESSDASSAAAVSGLLRENLSMLVIPFLSEVRLSQVGMARVLGVPEVVLGTAPRPLESVIPPPCPDESLSEFLLASLRCVRRRAARGTSRGEGKLLLSMEADDEVVKADKSLLYEYSLSSNKDVIGNEAESYLSDLLSGQRDKSYNGSYTYTFQDGKGESRVTLDLSSLAGVNRKVKVFETMSHDEKRPILNGLRLDEDYLLYYPFMRDVIDAFDVRLMNYVVPDDLRADLVTFMVRATLNYLLVRDLRVISLVMKRFLLSDKLVADYTDMSSVDLKILRERQKLMADNLVRLVEEGDGKSFDGNLGRCLLYLRCFRKTVHMEYVYMNTVCGLLLKLLGDIKKNQLMVHLGGKVDRLVDPLSRDLLRVVNLNGAYHHRVWMSCEELEHELTKSYVVFLNVSSGAADEEAVFTGKVVHNDALEACAREVNKLFDHHYKKSVHEIIKGINEVALASHHTMARGVLEKHGGDILLNVESRKRYLCHYWEDLNDLEKGD